MTMIGACGPYNLGGSATLYQMDNIYVDPTYCHYHDIQALNLLYT